MCDLFDEILLNSLCCLLILIIVFYIGIHLTSQPNKLCYRNVYSFILKLTYDFLIGWIKVLTILRLITVIKLLCLSRNLGTQYL